MAEQIVDYALSEYGAASLAELNPLYFGGVINILSGRRGYGCGS